MDTAQTRQHGPPSLGSLVAAAIVIAPLAVWSTPFGLFAGYFVLRDLLSGNSEFFNLLGTSTVLMVLFGGWTVVPSLGVFVIVLIFIWKEEIQPAFVFVGFWAGAIIPSIFMIALIVGGDLIWGSGHGSLDLFEVVGMFSAIGCISGALSGYFYAFILKDKKCGYATLGPLAALIYLSAVYSIGF